MKKSGGEFCLKKPPAKRVKFVIFKTIQLKWTSFKTLLHISFPSGLYFSNHSTTPLVLRWLRQFWLGFCVFEVNSWENSEGVFRSFHSWHPKSRVLRVSSIIGFRVEQKNPSSNRGIIKHSNYWSSFIPRELSPPAHCEELLRKSEFIILLCSQVTREHVQTFSHQQKVTGKGMFCMIICLFLPPVGASRKISLWHIYLYGHLHGHVHLRFRLTDTFQYACRASRGKECHQAIRYMFMTTQQ